MTLLVTGATGFLGGAVVRALRAAGHDVRATGRDRARGAALGDGVTFVAADLAEPGEVAPLARGVDIVVHCAALSSPWGPRAAFERANVRATECLLEASLRAGVRRFVHVSTPSVYMGQGPRTLVREDDLLPPPINEYARTKLLAERRVAAAHGLERIVLRPRALFGPGDTTIFPRLVRALGTGRLPIFGDGTNVVDLTYVDDAARAVLCACHAGAEAVGAVCNVTGGEPIALWPFLAELARRLGYRPPSRRIPRAAALALAHAAELAASLRRDGREPVLTRYGVHVLADTMTLDITRARTRLGYAPRVSMAEGLDRFVHSLEERP